MAPSQLLPGLMEGASLRFPQARPTKYAAVSAIHTRTSTSSTSSGCSVIMASPAGTSTAKPAAASHSVSLGRTPRHIHSGATTIQKSAAVANTVSLIPARASAMKTAATAASKPSAAPRPRPQSCAHSCAAASRISAIRSCSPSGGSRNSAASSAAISTAAVAIRAASCPLGDLGTLRRFELLAGTAEAPLAAAVGSDGEVERRGVEVGPQRVGEIKLGVRKLPQQEVADALLAAGADEEVRLRRIAHGEVGKQRFFVHRLAGVLGDEPVDGLQDVPAAAVVRGDGEGEPLVGGGEALARLDGAMDGRVEAAGVAHHPEAHAVAMQLL